MKNKYMWCIHTLYVNHIVMTNLTMIPVTMTTTGREQEWEATERGRGRDETTAIKMLLHVLYINIEI